MYVVYIAWFVNKLSGKKINLTDIDQHGINTAL